MIKSYAVLVVEDDPALGELTRVLLVHLGHRAKLAPSLRHARDYLHREHEFRIIILDLELPDGRGESLIQHLADKAIRTPAIIIFSAQPQHELQSAARATGAAAVLRKPCSQSDVERAIELAAA